MKKKNILIFPCGSENGINMYDSLKYNIHFELFGATSKYDHSEYIYDEKHLKIGNFNIHDEDFLKNFNSMLKLFSIDYIIPTHDEIINFLVNNAERINAVIIASPKETCNIAFSKIETYKTLKNKNYLPIWYQDYSNLKFPIFIKPNHGAGGKGACIINNMDEFNKINNPNNYLISEYLPGDEITIDCFTNKNRELMFIGPRTRERITTGISFRSKNIKLTSDIKEIAEDLNKTLKFRGLWFFQLKKDNKGKYKLMEISVRCAGTMSLYRMLGINFASLSLFDFMGYDLEIIKNNFNIQLDRYYKCCYKTNINYNYVYIDFDDTIIVNHKVNTTIISFLYQCLNNNKKIILITKHIDDIVCDMHKYHISKDIFYKIINIKEDEKKSKYIKHYDAIFIDNYYFDRKDVYINSQIPVFDVDAVDALMNYEEV